MDREEGFYWIKLYEKPEVALWEQGVWWIAGNEQELRDAEVISDRLSPPRGE